MRGANVLALVWVVVVAEGVVVALDGALVDV